MNIIEKNITYKIGTYFFKKTDIGLDYRYLQYLKLDICNILILYECMNYIANIKLIYFLTNPDEILYSWLLLITHGGVITL